jgi:hypothetical protein
VLKYWHERRTEAGSTEATDTWRDRAVSGGVRGQRYAAERVLSESGPVLGYSQPSSEGTAKEAPGSYAPRFFPDSLIARSSASQTSLPLHGSPSIHRLERKGCCVKAILRQLSGTGQLQRDERHSRKTITTIQKR